MRATLLARHREEAERIVLAQVAPSRVNGSSREPVEVDRRRPHAGRGERVAIERHARARPSATVARSRSACSARSAARGAVSASRFQIMRALSVTATRRTSQRWRSRKRAMVSSVRGSAAASRLMRSGRM